MKSFIAPKTALSGPHLSRAITVTAKALGLTAPPQLLARADEVIE